MAAEMEQQTITSMDLRGNKRKRQRLKGRVAYRRRLQAWKRDWVRHEKREALKKESDEASAQRLESVDREVADLRTEGDALKNKCEKCAEAHESDLKAAGCKGNKEVAQLCGASGLT